MIRTRPRAETVLIVLIHTLIKAVSINMGNLYIICQLKRLKFRMSKLMKRKLKSRLFSKKSLKLYRKA